MTTSYAQSSRIQRALAQSIYLIDISSMFGSSGIQECNVHVMGSSGSDYIVSLVSDNNTISCTCPDQQRRKQHCKHIYFVLIRYLRMREQDIDEENITKDTIRNIVSRVFEIAIANTQTNRPLWVSNTNDEVDEVDEVEPRDIDDECPICYEDMIQGDDFIRCQYSCGRRVHAQCYEMWQRHNTHTNTCVYCRANL